MLFDKDAGHKVYMEDVYECESRIPAGSWGPASVPWTDVVCSLRLLVHSFLYYLLINLINLV